MGGNEFKTVKVQDVAEFETGFPFKSVDFARNGIRLIRGSNVKRGVLDFAPELVRFWSKNDPVPSKYEMRTGDIVIAMDGALVGRSFAQLEIEDTPSYLVQRVARLRGVLVEQGLLYQWIKSESFSQHVDLRKTHTAIPHISPRDVKDFAISIPVCRREQERIADALDLVDELISGLALLVSKKRDIKQGVMQQLLTGRTRLPGFVSDWEVRPLSSISSMKGRIGWQGLTQNEFSEDSRLPFLITGMNFKDGKIRWNEVYHVSEERYQVAPEIQLCSGDVLMTKDGTIGKVLFVDRIPPPSRATLNSHLLLFRPIDRKYDPKFFYYLLQSRRFLEHIELHKSGSTFFGISQESVGKYELELPPLEEQTAIAAVLTALDKDLELLEQKLAKMKDIKQGMIQELLTGRVRLSESEEVKS